MAKDGSGNYGPGALRDQYPDWFSDEVIPEQFSGEPFHDPEMRWVGTCLSAFGICYNVDVLERLGIEEPPDNWDDLTDPEFSGHIALSDPTKSGSVTKAFEMIIQQQIRNALNERLAAGKTREEVEAEAVRDGWNRAMRMILKIAANSRYFTDMATKIPHDVAQGNGCRRHVHRFPTAGPSTNCTGKRTEAPGSSS